MVIGYLSFRKSTAGNTILHSKSCHPYYICHNIPYGEMDRSRINCSNTLDFLLESQQIQERLGLRGYPGWILRQAANRAFCKDRASLLKDNTIESRMGEKKKMPVVFSTAFSLEYNSICNLVKKYMPILIHDPALSTAG